MQTINRRHNGLAFASLLLAILGVLGTTAIMPLTAGTYPSSASLFYGIDISALIALILACITGSLALVRTGTHPETKSGIWMALVGIFIGVVAGFFACFFLLVALVMSSGSLL